MPVEVDHISDFIANQATEWKMLEALMGGTTAMRLAGKSYLPQWPDEDPEGYAARLGTATLFPAYRRTVRVMASKPFAKEVAFSDETPPEMLAWADDIDREGVSLNVFAQEMFEESFFGLAGILVEAPRAIQAAGRVPTQAEQKAAGVRPYWVRVKHDQILGGKIRVVNGAKQLIQLRILETDTADDGEYGETVVVRVRVLTPGAWKLVTKQTNGAWSVNPGDEGATSLPYIPFVPLYGSRLGFMIGRPPLADLAHMNVEHWQSKSDQQTILHFARVPILFGKGFSGDIVMGSSTVLTSEAGGADVDLKWVEHTGSSVEAGAKSLTQLEDQMVQAGAELMVKKASGSRTATEDQNDQEANKSDLQRQTEGFEDSLNLAMYYTAQLGGLPASGEVELFKDFGAANLSEASATLIKDMVAGQMISRETGIEEMKRRGELGPKVDAKTEAERIDAEGPLLGDIPPADPLKPPSPGPGAD